MWPLLRLVFGASAILIVHGVVQATPELISLEQRITAARAALEKADASQSSRSVEQTAAIARLFDLLDETGQLESDEAKVLVERGLEMQGNANPKNGVAYALALERSARVQCAHRNVKEATSIGEHALALVEQTLPRDEDAEASVFTAMGCISTVAQDPDSKGSERLETAIKILDRHAIVDLRLARALQYLSFTYRFQNKLDLAQTTIDRALATAAALEGSDSPLVAETLTVQSYIARARGDAATAIGQLERATDILRKAEPPRRAAYARALLALAQTLNNSGNVPEAEKHYREVIALESSAPTGSGFVLAGAHNGLGLTMVSYDRNAEAADNFAIAATLYRNLFGPDFKATWYAENNLAIAYMHIGRLDEAATLLRHVIEVTDRAPAGSDESTTPARSNLGHIYVWQGRYAEAEQLYRSYLTRIGPGHDVGEIDVRFPMLGLTASLWAQGRDEEAFAEALAAERSLQNVLRIEGADLSEEHALRMRDWASGGLDWMVAIAARNQRPDLARTAWALAIESRGLVSTTSARRLAVARASKDPELTAVWNEWKTQDEGLVQARINAARDPSQATADALGAAEQKFNAAERALAHAAGASGAALGRSYQGLEPVLAALPSNDTLLVSYVEAEHTQPSDQGQIATNLHPRLYAFVARRGVPPKLIDLGPRQKIDEAARAWLALVSDRGSDAKSRDDAGRRVRELAWDPIAAKWPQKRVLVVPSPVLERIPFAALPAQDGHYLVEDGFVFHLLDHERDVLASPAPSSAFTLSLIGAPDFTADPQIAAGGTRGVCAGLRGATFAALPQAAREIDELRDVWSKRNDAMPPTVLVGADATEARARQVLSSSRIVHFATHGIFLGDQCAVPLDDTRGVKTVDIAGASHDTEDFSALVLSGANRPASSTENDGLLTSEEIATFDLTGTDWAVLSACDSGIGKNIRGEGVFGLRRAFRLAGVRSVVMSLWPVSDKASADWMVHLYRARLQEHATTMDAVRAADLALIKQRRDAGLDSAPFYWAAFVAAGDWR